MPLTTVVGSSGSGKTTFLNDLNKQSKCVYIRQYHQIRPYLMVSRIPNFDATKLPYWSIYEGEGTANKIPAGGTMAGEFTPGLSGGQRKLLLFELIVQRATQCGQKLLIVLDEPFSGVTDDFVPWIVERLDFLRSNGHNIVLVTNDHVHTLMELADNTITVSAVNRNVVSINQDHTCQREMVLHALSSTGVDYMYPKATQNDLIFFFNVEILSSKAVLGVACFTIFFFALFLVSFWDSQTSSYVLILIAGDIIAFFSVNPYLLSLVDWRNAVTEEAEALVHSSKAMNKLLKTILCALLIFVVCSLEFGMVNAVVSGLEDAKFLLAMFCDTGSTTLPFVVFGLYTTWPHQVCETLALLPFLFLIFFSTTFSPGAGVPVVKELRYLFARFYFWCMVPGAQEYMEGCPENETLNILLMCLTGLGTVFLFVIFVAIKNCLKSTKKAKVVERRDTLQKDAGFQALVEELFGGDAVSSRKQWRQSEIGSKSKKEISDRASVPSPSSPKKQYYEPTANPGDTEVDC
ncbi:expressed unknown protein [Seminavis robusta]|uniref:Uncharacterized protein n=1 Tax=Seminavis robusta TaxID=568900 RepID=A0A9N8ER38_9STRA|nr:expressed unknown protein [Seminavis robusta]|eukprot:Sro1711_g292790.1 n/a (519) ;mRNA; f:1736-3681